MKGGTFSATVALNTFPGPGTRREKSRAGNATASSPYGVTNEANRQSPSATAKGRIESGDSGSNGHVR